MILQSLCELYERRNQSDDPNARPAPDGWEYKEIPFVIELSVDGEFVQLMDMRTLPGKPRPRAKPVLVPKSEGRQGTLSWQTANLLWDHYGYVLGFPKGDQAKEHELAKKQLGAFTGRVDALVQNFPANEGFRAVQAFLHSEGQRTRALASGAWQSCAEIKGCNLSFRISGQLALVCAHPDVQSIIGGSEGGPSDDPEAFAATCLVTGESSQIARLHTAISGVTSKPAPLLAANTNELPSVSSYGRQQGGVFPVSTGAAFSYATALNDLLRRGSRQRIQVGDASTVFWADRDEALVDDFASLFGEPAKDDPARNVDRIKALYDAIRSGKYQREHDGRDRFYILGLAPNAARIAVRFWRVSTVAEVSTQITRHFVDLAIVHAPHDPDFLSLFRLLSACAAQGKAENIPPNLGGDVMRAILEGLPYPQTLMQAAVRRCRAEQDVNYARAAVIKGSLNRFHRVRPSGEKELTVALDLANPSTAYRLGRLFAVLEKAQEEANPDLNATIRERYYGAASSAPVTVFTTLLRLKNHHLAKLDNRGRAVNLERLIGEIMSGFADFPAQLTIADQGRFAIGYYHQRQAFFAKSEPAPESTAEPQGETA